MKKRVSLILVALVVIIPVFITFLVNPLTKPKGWIRKDLLKLTPIGTSIKDVINIAEINKIWEYYHINENNGYEVDKDGHKIIIPGLELINVDLGKYFRGIYVSAHYDFDEKSKLIDITVFKEYDML